ncbi:MAG TPA: hypothetical protein DEQ14_05320, partial [Treponema sp.]|nr:hypothetical protein [Treponema sp.]
MVLYNDLARTRSGAEKSKIFRGSFLMICGHRKTFGFLCVMIFLGAFLSAQNRQAVLVRGNHWITENNLFADGTLAALFGEYKTAIPADSSSDTPGVFFVRVSANNQLLSGEGWQPRTGSRS